jgi:hypothetical protein
MAKAIGTRTRIISSSNMAKPISAIVMLYTW